MATIHIDGKTVEVDGADNLLQACLSLGLDVPYFCYHPALGSVGSCRQCAVKQYNNEDDYKAGRGRLVMSCMVAPTEDMYISIDDDEAKTFRKRIVEYIMTNHPHDCPTCEEGGHCHLQDMTYMSGHRARRYRFTKRTHHNQDLGVFINHEMNRCIACYRCVRYYKDYAGGTDFGVYASNNRVYFGREADGQFESEFSGNLTEVCPTGVFTDKTHSERYNRKWDMQYAPSICHGCSTGCNISAGERYGELRRIENRYNHDVNGYFLCDKGRFGYGYVNRADRPIQPLEKVGDKHIAISADYALDGVAKLLQGKKAIGIGSPQASLESNFALKRLVGADGYSTGELMIEQGLVADAVALLRHQKVHNVSLAEIEKADTVFILGEDLTQTAPRVALSVRQAAKNKALQMADALKTQDWLAEPVKRIGQNAYSPIYVASVTDTKLDNIAKVSAVASISDIARLGFLVGDVIAGFGATLTQIDDSEQQIFAKESELGTQMSEDDAMYYLAHHIAYDLVMADRPLVIAGTSLVSKEVVAATGYIAQSLTNKRSQIKDLERQSVEVYHSRLRAETDTPTHDADKMGRPENVGTPADVALESQVVRNPDEKPPEEHPAYVAQTSVYMSLPHANSVGVNLLGGLSLEEVLAVDSEIAIVMEHDLANFSPALQDKLFDKTLIVLDHQSYPWHAKAEYVLSGASFAESDGTLVSAEGRAQRFFAAFDKKYYVPLSEVKDAWRWLGAIYDVMHNEQTGFTHLDDVIDELSITVPTLALIKEAAPDAQYRITGLKLAREPRRYSGRTSMRAKISIHEPMQPKDTDTALTFSMEGYVGDKTPASAVPFAWSAGWNSPQAWNKLQDKVGGRLKGGDVGIRLFDHLPKTDKTYEKHALPSAGETSIFEGRAVLVPVYNLFSSSALVSSSPVVASQIQPATWLIARDDAERWHIKAGDMLTISQQGVSVSLPVALTDYVADGCIGYPAEQVPLQCNLPASVKKAENASIYEPAYIARIKAIDGKTAPSLSAFNRNLMDAQANITTQTNNTANTAQGVM